ncbi:thrombospondin type-1 domain-containing protein [Roseovarius sp. MBR-78]|uniref:thrombospondin type-1 domain-containing protein n=1 Tax=Roseovarius sp. MBR-78 TaxID=3156460 RepID=UPI00339305FC
MAEATTGCLTPLTVDADGDTVATGSVQIGDASTCNGASEGLIRYKGSVGFPQYCDGSNWRHFAPTGWYTSSWSACSNSCTDAYGAGTQTRTVECRLGSTQVDDSFCQGTKPASSQSCTNNSGCTYTWITGGWSTCSASPYWNTGSWGSCQGASWQTGSWGSCSVSCGGGTQSRSVYCSGGTQARSVTCEGTSGTQTRTVYCRRDQDGASVSGSYCGGGKPAGSQSCSESCSGSQPSSTQSCNSGCSSSSQPASSQSCNTQSCCTPSDQITSTGSCSASCGGGTQTVYWSDGCGSTWTTTQSCNTQPCGGGNACDWNDPAKIVNCK